jgi:hypothetical protein
MVGKRSLNNPLRDAAAESAKARSDDVVIKVRAMLTIIDSEIEANHGIYPHPGTKLGQREFCRRAGIHFQTLQSPAHKNTTRLEVVEFLTKHKTNTSKREIKSSVASKVDYWQGEHQKVATQIGIYELQLNEKDVLLRQAQTEHEKKAGEAREEIERLRVDNDLLREKLSLVLSDKKVSPIRKRRSLDEH